MTLAAFAAAGAVALWFALRKPPRPPLPNDETGLRFIFDQAQKRGLLTRERIAARRTDPKAMAWDEWVLIGSIEQNHYTLSEEQKNAARLLLAGPI